MLADVVSALFFGAVQGISEFWPISSSGHLVLLHALFPGGVPGGLAFDVALHLGTLSATVWFFRLDLQGILRAFVGRHSAPDRGRQRLLGLAIVAGTVPTLVIAFLLRSVAEGPARTPLVVAALLLIGGVLFLIVERSVRQRKPLQELTLSDAVVIGIAQGVAVIPGVSRSGASIIAGLLLGLQREAAARFSFLLSLPIIVAASVQQLGAYFASGPRGEDLGLFLIGFLASAAVGFFALRFLIRILAHTSLAPFGYYRIGVGILVLLFLALR